MNVANNPPKREEVRHGNKRFNIYIQSYAVCLTLNICSFVHQCNTFTSYFLLIVDMFRPHTAIFGCYSILSRSCCSVIFALCYIDGQKNKYSVLNECNRMLKYNMQFA
jgi:hypothetical protein